MQKKRQGRIVGREAAQRTALWRTLMSSLLIHGSIVTTEAKAKELRLVCEPLVTLAKRGNDLATRRLLIAALGNKEAAGRMLAAGKAAQKRPGGYLRLTRLPKLRGDASRMMKVDLVDGKS